MSAKVTRQCLTCGKAFTRFRSQAKRAQFDSKACRLAYGLIQVRCSWPGCQTLMPARVSQRARDGGVLEYKTTLTTRGTYAKFPICSGHWARLRGALGKVRLHSFHRIITNLDRGYDNRKISTRMLRFILFERAGGRCQGCQSPLEFNAPPKTWQVDHMIPIFRGGATKIDNLQVLCRACHDLKSGPEKAAASRQRHVAHKNGRWLTHHEKDQLIETLRAENAALRADLARLAAERHEEPVP